MPVFSPCLQTVAPSMLAGAFAPNFPIDLVAKDFDLIPESAEDAGTQAPVSAATGAVFRAAAESGYAADNISGVVQLYR